MSAPVPARPGRILVTGGCGYLGSRLLRDLVTDPALGGPVVRILDNLAQGSPRALMALPPEGRYEFLEADLLDPSAVRMALRDVEAVVHLAAVVSTPITFDNRPVISQVNHWGTGQLVDACLEAGVRRFVFASTAAVYGVGGPFEEDDPCQPLGFYAQSKLQGERTVQAAGERGLAWTILRFGSLFGLAPVVWFHTVANRFAYLAGVGRTLPIYGAGTQRRPLVHVKDASAAVRLALAQPRDTNGRTLNAVTFSPSVEDIVEALRGVRPTVEVRYTEQQVMEHLSVEVQGEAIRRAGWRPEVGLQDGLEDLLNQFGLFAPVGHLARGL